MESSQYHASEIAGLSSYNQKVLKGIHEDRKHKGKWEYAKDERNPKVEEQDHNVAAAAKSRVDCSSTLLAIRLNIPLCNDEKKKLGYKLYSSENDKNIKKLIRKKKERKYYFEPQRLSSEIRAGEAHSNPYNQPHGFRKSLPINTFQHPITLLVKPQVVTKLAYRSKPSISPALNQKTALNSQSITVHVLPPDPYYSANDLLPQRKVASTNANEISSYVNFKLPTSPVFRNVIDKNGQLVQQFIDAKPIPHTTFHQPVMMHHRQQYEPAIAKHPGQSYINQNHIRNTFQNVKDEKNSVPESSYSKISSKPSKYQHSNTIKSPVQTQNYQKELGNLLHNSKKKSNDNPSSPESSYSKISSNPSKSQHSHGSKGETSYSQSNDHLLKDHKKNRDFREDIKKTRPHNSFASHSERHNEADDDDHGLEHEHLTDRTPNINSESSSKVPVPGHSESEEDTATENYPPHTDDTYYTNQEDSPNDSRESNDYDEDPSFIDDHHHARDKPQPHYRQKQAPSNNEKLSSSDVGGTYDEPSSSEEPSFKQTIRKYDFSNRKPKHYKVPNNYFSGNENDNDSGEIHYKNHIDKKDIENDKMEYHRKKYSEENIPSNHGLVIHGKDQNPKKSAAQYHENNYNHKSLQHNNDENRPHINAEHLDKPMRSNTEDSANLKDKNVKNHNKPNTYAVNKDSILLHPQSHNKGHYTEATSHHSPTQGSDYAVSTPHLVEHHNKHVFPVTQLYKLAGVIGNSVTLHGSALPHKHLQAPNHLVSYNNAPILRNEFLHNSVPQEDNAKGIPYHVLLKQSNIPLTFNHLQPAPINDNYSQEKKATSVHRPNQISSVHNINLHENPDQRDNGYLTRIPEEDDGSLRYQQLKENEKDSPRNSDRDNNYNKASSDSGEDDSNHHQDTSARYNDEQSSNEEDIPDQERDDDQRYKEESSVHKEEHPHPQTDVDHYPDEESITEDDESHNYQANGKSKKNQEASSNEEENFKNVQGNKRGNINNPSDSEEENYNPHQDNEGRYKNEDESRDESENIRNHDDNDNEPTSNEDVRNDDEEQEEKPQEESSDDEEQEEIPQEESSDDEEQEEVPQEESLDDEDDGPPHDQNNGRKYIQESSSREEPYHQNNNPKNDEDSESAEQSLSQQEKKDLFKRHFDNEFGIIPSNYHTSENNPPYKLKQKLQKQMQESTQNAPQFDDYPNRRRSFHEQSENQSNKPSITSVGGFMKRNLHQRAVDVPPNRNVELGSLLNKEGSDLFNESINKSYGAATGSPYKKQSTVLKVNRPQFESFGNFFSENELF